MIRMRMDQEERNGVRILHDSGRVDLLEAPELRQRLLGLAGQPGRTIVSLAGVDFVDSSGLGALLNGFRSIERSGGQLRITDLSRPVRALLQLPRLDALLPLHETLEEAMQSFESMETNPHDGDTERSETRR